MMQVVDRRSHAGPSSTTTARTVSSPITSPKKASGFPTSPRIPSMPDSKQPHTLTKNSLWSGRGEDNAMARTQQFIIETHKNPIHFKLSDAPISAEVSYPPINDSNIETDRKSPTTSSKTISKDGTVATSPYVYTSSTKDEGESSSPKAQGSMASPPSKDLFLHRISLHPPKEASEKGIGLSNKGNTCYMNSTLQALLHLPPLSHALLTYERKQLYGRLGAKPNHKFDAVGEMISLAERVLLKSNGIGSTAPMAFINNLKSYARTLSKFRQEDAHEFLRFLMEAMQTCCLIQAPKSLKPNDPIRETTLIHKIFGGKLRSRVQCQRCQYNSDTFDPILDLSLDLRKSTSVNEALDKFTSVDKLTGSERYRCEKCKMAVDATKWFTIHEAPMILTIHLKRFTLSGQKINREIRYPDSLVLTRDMLSEGKAPQHYKLRSVVHHHGSGPNSGHYIASVKGNGSNRWYEMNDNYVSSIRQTPINDSSAYILFYVRDPAHALNTAVQSESLINNVNNNNNNNNNKRRLSEMDTDERRNKRREDNNNSSTFFSPASLPSKPLAASSPSVLQPRQQQQYQRSTINPVSFYGSSPTPPKAKSTNSSKPTMFRNMDSVESEGEDNDDVGEKIQAPETQSSRPSNNNNNNNNKKRKHHRDTLGLNIRAGDQKSKFHTSPYSSVGSNTLGKPLHAKMKDKHGNAFK